MLAFSIDYYGIFFWATQFVELFCTYRVYEWTPGFCHAKMSVADDCMATCGTINLDYRSLYHHFENGCFMADCQAAVSYTHLTLPTICSV